MMIVTKALERNGAYLGDITFVVNLSGNISTADDVYVQTANHQVLIFMFVFFWGCTFSYVEKLLESNWFPI